MGVLGRQLYLTSRNAGYKFNNGIYFGKLWLNVQHYCKPLKGCVEDVPSPLLCNYFLNTLNHSYMPFPYPDSRKKDERNVITKQDKLNLSKDIISLGFERKFISPN